MASQAQKHVTHNEAIRKLDAIVQLSILDRNLSAPPASPSDGDRYIVAGGATAEWAGHEEKIAAFQDGSWMIYSPGTGWVCWVVDEDKLVVWDGTGWEQIAGDQVKLGINTAASDSDRLAVKTNSILFSHDDVTPGTGDVQTKLNKASSSNNASFLFQSNWSGRAEIGLTGDDDFHFKVSADGSTWYNALSIDRNSGATHIEEFSSTGIDDNASTTTLTLDASNNVGIGLTPSAKLDVDGIIKMKSYTIATLPTATAGGMIYVSDETGGAVMAFSDGSNWLRCTDRAIVS